MSRRELLLTLRAVLPWYLAVVGIPGAVWLCIHFYLQASPSLRAAAASSVSIVFGAVVGALTIYVGQAVYERRKKRGELIARLPALAYEATATLVESYAARGRNEEGKADSGLSLETSRMFRLDGAIAQFEIEWRAAFHSRKARAALNKMRQRINLTKD